MTRDDSSDSSDSSGLGRRGYLKTTAIAGLLSGGLGGVATAGTDKSTGKQLPGEDTNKDPEPPDQGNFKHLGNHSMEVIVSCSNQNGMEQARNVADEVLEECDKLEIISIRAATENLKELIHCNSIQYVEQNHPVEAFQQTVPWGVERIGADIAIEAGELATNSSVAVLDTGIDSTHSELAPNLGEGIAFVDCVGSCAEPWDDDNGHGTHVAGTIGARTDGGEIVGTAPETTLHAVKVLDNNGAGTTMDIVSGIEWTALEGHDVANVSLGTPFYSQALAEACEFATNEGVLLVGAAGNAGPCSDCIAYPAALDDVVAVTAIDPDDDLAMFSSTGPEAELAAPGVSILSTIPGDNYAFYSGTSSAAPHVSGAAAHLMANGLNKNTARDVLQETAEDLGLNETEQGYGLVDVAAALDQVT